MNTVTKKCFNIHYYKFVRRLPSPSWPLPSLFPIECQSMNPSCWINVLHNLQVQEIAFHDFIKFLKWCSVFDSFISFGKEAHNWHPLYLISSVPYVAVLTFGICRWFLFLKEPFFALSLKISVMNNGLNPF